MILSVQQFCCATDHISARMRKQKNAAMQRAWVAGGLLTMFYRVWGQPFRRQQ